MTLQAATDRLVLDYFRRRCLASSCCYQANARFQARLAPIFGVLGGLSPTRTLHRFWDYFRIGGDTPIITRSTSEARIFPCWISNQSGSNLHLTISFIGARYTIAPPWSNRPRRELVDENPAVEDSAYPLGFPAPDGEAADGRHASDHARSPIYRTAAPRCLSKKALISPKASFVSGA